MPLKAWKRIVDIKFYLMKPLLFRHKYNSNIAFINFTSVFLGQNQLIYIFLENIQL
jgi:hypothetical protein